MLKLATIQKLTVVYLIIWTISPFMEIGMNWRLLALAAAGIWFVLALIRNGASIDRMELFAVVFALAVALIACIQSGGFSSVLSQIPIYMLVIFYLMYRFYEGRWEELKGLLWIIILLFIVFNLRSASAVSVNPQIARSLVRDDESTYVYLRQGIGGYSLIYPQVIIFPALLRWTEKAFRRNLFLFVIGAVWLFSFLWFVMIAGYSIAVFSCIIGVFMLHIYKGKNIGGVMLVTLLILIAGMFLVAESPVVQRWLLQIFNGTGVEKKIHDMIYSAETGTAQGTIYDRIVAYRGSLRTILKYPFIGGLWWASGGGHSAVLDILAKYGVLGVYVYAKMLYAVPRDYRLNAQTLRGIRTVNAALSVILFVSILDSFTYAFMGMLLIGLPLILEDILKWSEAANESALDSQSDTSDPG